MAILNLGQDVVNKRERKNRSRSYSGQILFSIARMRRYGSFININPSGLRYIWLSLKGYRENISFSISAFGKHQTANYYEKSAEMNKYKTGVINDPLDQNHSLASSEHCFLCFVLLYLKSGDGRTDGRTDERTDGRTDGRTTCAKAIISTCHVCGLSEWIKSFESS